MTSSSVPFAAKNLTKRYGEHVALADLTLTIPEGRIVGRLHFLESSGAPR